MGRLKALWPTVRLLVVALLMHFGFGFLDGWDEEEEEGRIAALRRGNTAFIAHADSLSAVLKSFAHATEKEKQRLDSLRASQRQENKVFIQTITNQYAHIHDTDSLRVILLGRAESLRARLNG